MNPDNHANDPRLRSAVAAHPYPILFATISGAHLYGFPSADSDFDLRGVHLLPPEKLLGLEVTDETLTHEQIIGGLEVDLVTHDARKFFRLMLKKNGYVLEQIFSPLVVHAMQPHFDTPARHRPPVHYPAPRRTTTKVSRKTSGSCSTRSGPAG